MSCIVPVWDQQDLIIRALKSIPEHWQIIVIDDGSTDNTHHRIKEWLDKQPESRYIVYSRNERNMGVGMTVNRGYDMANGEYVVLLGSDDYFLPAITDVESKIDGSDMVFFDMVDDTGRVWKLNPETEHDIPGSVKFVKTGLIGSLRNDGRRMGEDLFLMDKLREKNPTMLFTGVVAKHYTYPRKGSLTDIAFGTTS